MIFRAFTATDQLEFAQLSGDNNPLHLDPIAARRTMFGAQVVHGVHGVLRALDSSLGTAGQPLKLVSLKAMFYKPIRIDDELELEITQEEATRQQIRIEHDGTILTKIIAAWEPATQDTVVAERQSGYPAMTEPRALSDEEIAQDSGSLDLLLNSDLAEKLFPTLVQHLHPDEIASIVHLSRLVGVRCPGLHSLFSEFQLSRNENPEQSELGYAVEKFDHRIGLATITVSEPLFSGQVKAFRRPPPQNQPSYNELCESVTDGEFAGQRALVIGGSRGLGEVTTKLLAGGGADVKFTYHQGVGDAQEIAREICDHGGHAGCFQYDVLNPGFAPEDVAADGWKPTHVYYFATPFIFSGVKGKFSAELFRKFCDYYVTGFANALDLLNDMSIEKVFYPSSVAIDELPNSMGEYASAKIASELLCDFLEKCNPGLVIYKSRFPRTDTDQTVSIMPVKSENPAALMLRELRAFKAL